MAKTSLNQLYYKSNKLQQIRGFIATVKYGSVTKAARALNLTQPSVSLQIVALEEDLGIKLFRKSGSSLEITEDGKRFYEMAVPLFQGIDSLYARFLEKRCAVFNNVISIAAHYSASIIILPKYLSILKTQDDTLQIHLANLPKAQILDRLAKQKLDVALYPLEEHEEIPADVEIQKAFRYEPVLIMSKDHPLAQKKDSDITADDITQAGNFLNTADYATDVIQTYIQKGILKTNITIECGNWEILKALTARNLGITIMHAGYLFEGDNLVYKKIDHVMKPDIYYCLMFPKGQTAKRSVQNLLDIMAPDFDK